MRYAQQTPTTYPIYLPISKADGYLARRYKMSSVLGTVLDPAADKILMTTLVVSLTHQDLIPRKSHPAFHAPAISNDAPITL